MKKGKLSILALCAALFVGGANSAFACLIITQTGTINPTTHYCTFPAMTCPSDHPYYTGSGYEDYVACTRKVYCCTQPPVKRTVEHQSLDLAKDPVCEE